MYLRDAVWSFAHRLINFVLETAWKFIYQRVAVLIISQPAYRFHFEIALTCYSLVGCEFWSFANRLINFVLKWAW